MFKNLFKKRIKNGSVVVDKNNKIWIVNGLNVNEDIALVDTFKWISKRCKVDYCKAVKLSELKLID